jgi:hypothetical protein
MLGLAAPSGFMKTDSFVATNLRSRTGTALRAGVRTSAHKSEERRWRIASVVPGGVREGVHAGEVGLFECGRWSGRGVLRRRSNGGHVGDSG